MRARPWPLKNRLPAGYVPFTKGDLRELRDAFDVDDDTPVWIDNDRQIRHGIAQRPIEVMTRREDGVHLG